MGTAKTLRKLLGGKADASIRFEDLCALLEALGFERRVRGGHHLFHQAGVDGLLNLQRDGDKAKRYQIRQARELILQYRLGLEEEEVND